MLYLWADDDLRRNAPEKALVRLRRIAAAYPDSPWAKKANRYLPGALLLVGEKHLHAGRFDQASKAFATLLQKYPTHAVADNARKKDAKLMADWAAKLLAQGELEAAQAKWRALARRYPENPHLTGPSDMVVFGKVIQRIKTPTAAGATPAQMMEAWAQHLGKLGRHREARVLRDKIARKYSGSPEALKQRERAARHMYEQAMATLQRAKPEAALALLQRLLAEHPKSRIGERARGIVNHIKATPKGMVYVPAGVSVMGLSPDDVTRLAGAYKIPSIWHKWFDAEVPSREVNLPAFYMDRTELTNGEYKLFVDDADYPAPPSPAWLGRNVRRGFENHPVTHVNWHDALAYAKWAGKRLPAEAEWEKAARGTDARRFPWGNEFDAARARVGGGGRRTAPVGSHPKGVSPFGCLDMVGNVREWVADDCNPYPDSPAGAEPRSGKVCRGGSWAEEAPYFNTCTHRAAAAPNRRSGDVGFRCARSP